MFFFDPLYLVVLIPTTLLALYAQIKVSSAFKKYKKVANSSGITGAQAAYQMLAAAGLHKSVRIEERGGFLSDHYDPRNRVIRLSPPIYRGRSVAATGVACHEVGHAIQHKEGYALLSLRNAIVPLASVGSWLSWPLIILGMILAMSELLLAGILIFAVVVLFQLLTLPVEFNATARAKKKILELRLVNTKGEYHGAEAVLSAAALTYVAATIGAIAQLLYFLLRFGFIGGDD